MTMREKMARAMYEADRGPHQTPMWEHIASSIRDRYYGYVNAALDVQMEPSEGVLDAMRVGDGKGLLTLPTVFCAAIQAIKDGK